jgi:hypothetical protein
MSMDESVWIDVLARRSFSHLIEVFRLYKEINKIDIETSVQRNLSGSLEVAFLGFLIVKNFI